jgi:hypothetical protein
VTEPQRVFTVEEADRSLVSLRDALLRIRAARRQILRDGRLVSGPEGGARRQEVEVALRILREELEHLAAEGVILRDADSGAIDFPTRRGGRLAFLCWNPEEPSVAYWHEADHGLGSRKPLDRAPGDGSDRK